MLRIPVNERPDWRTRANEYGFHFHTMYGEPYWDERAYYQFTLKQIEQDLEDPTAELHQMCLSVVESVVKDDELMTKFGIPEPFWQAVADSWQRGEPSLYSRLDLAYSGKGPAKLLENNADTPTSLYESGFWQWLWLEELVDKGQLSKAADQFNSVQEKLVNRFAEIAHYYDSYGWHFSCCKDTEEDRGTVQYLQDCAKEAGLTDRFVFIEDIGLADTGVFTDLQDDAIYNMFKLYPWEFMLREEFAENIVEADVNWLEPLWKSILSNKALLVMLWQQFPNHPNLLPAYFASEFEGTTEGRWVKKPLFSREGANISVLENGETTLETPGPYGEEGFIIQQFCPMPKFADNYTLIGSWLIDDQPAGISIREDASPVTQDLSRYLPHIIL